MEQVYRIGTRRSPLALKQADEVIGALKEFYPLFDFEIVGIDTYGDKDKITSISEIEGSNFFTKEIDEALLRGEIDTERSRTIDFAVHSAKDLPDKIPEGLYIAAITKSIDPYDCLVSKNNLKLDELPLGTKIGASSLRRKLQLKKYRSDLQIVDIRGNIEERLQRLDNDGLDAIIVAACALVRLGLEDRIAERIAPHIMLAHPLQGSLAIEVRKNNEELINLLKVLDGK